MLVTLETLILGTEYTAVPGTEYQIAPKTVGRLKVSTKDLQDEYLAKSDEATTLELCKLVLEVEGDWPADGQLIPQVASAACLGFTSMFTPIGLMRLVRSVESTVTDLEATSNGSAGQKTDTPEMAASLSP